MFYPLHNLGDYFLFHISKGLDEKPGVTMSKMGSAGLPS